ncbi:hypothetical protein ACEPAH_532 [Sanghuangporus vaninii]
MDRVDEKELEAYQVQLSQAELALKGDPESAELQELVSELKTLIHLTEESIRQKQAQAAQSKAESSRKASQAGAAGKTWAAGDECLAKYSQDGQFYPARITSVGGAEDNRVYSIVFKGYNTTELVKANEIKPLTASYLSGPGPYGGGASSSGAGKRKLTKDEEDERERRKRRTEKKLELRAAKAKEQNEKKASWQKFAKKAEKKGVHIAGVSGTSIFKTPDNPYGKVGVTGSGKGMTENKERPKNKFVKDADNTS